MIALGSTQTPLVDVGAFHDSRESLQTDFIYEKLCSRQQIMFCSIWDFLLKYSILVHPVFTTAPIVYTLEEELIDIAPSFDALCYAWDSDKGNRQITSPQQTLPQECQCKQSENTVPHCLAIRNKGSIGQSDRVQQCLWLEVKKYLEPRHQQEKYVSVFSVLECVALEEPLFLRVPDSALSTRACVLSCSEYSGPPLSQEVAAPRPCVPCLLLGTSVYLHGFLRYLDQLPFQAIIPSHQRAPSPLLCSAAFDPILCLLQRYR